MSGPGFDRMLREIGEKHDGEPDHDARDFEMTEEEREEHGDQFPDE